MDFFESEKDKQNFKNFLGRIFTYNPIERITAKEALLHPFF